MMRFSLAPIGLMRPTASATALPQRSSSLRGG
jgi:hypothetical protein